MNCCAQPNLSFFQYQTICTGCGFILEDFFYETSYCDISRISTSNPLQTPLLSSLPPTKTPAIATALQPIKKRTRGTSRRDCHVNDLQDIKRVCSQYNITSASQDAIMAAWNVYLLCQKARKGTNRRGVLMVCFHRGLANSGDMRTRAEICDMFDMDEAVFRRGEKIIAPFFNNNMPMKDVFYGRFSRMVNEEKLPFFLASKMNDFFNKHFFELEIFANHITVGSVFIYVTELYHSEQMKTTDTKKRMNFKKRCSDFKISLPTFMKIKSILDKDC